MDRPDLSKIPDRNWVTYMKDCEAYMDHLDGPRDNLKDIEQSKTYAFAIQGGHVVWTSDDDSSGPCDPSAPEGSHIYVRADSGYEDLEAQLQASNERVEELQIACMTYFLMGNAEEREHARLHIITELLFISG